MKRLFALALAVVVGALVAAPGAWAGPVVQIMPNGFVPDAVTIPSDDSVTWTNKDTVPRQVVADAGAFRSPMLKPGESFTYMFPVAGTYSYRGAIKPAQRGAVTVRRVESRAVTIGASRRVVTHGGAVELAGSISSGEGGKEIRVLITPYRGVQTARSVITEPDGTWKLSVRPSIRTEYFVEFGSLISRSAPIVYVRPRLTLRVRNARSGQFVATARPGKAYAGKRVQLQRLIRNRWRTIDVARLGRNGAVRFRAAVPRGRQVLRLMSRPAPGYVAGYSSRVSHRR
jgi:plastocyanin